MGTRTRETVTTCGQKTLIPALVILFGSFVYYECSDLLPTYYEPLMEENEHRTWIAVPSSAIVPPSAIPIVSPAEVVRERTISIEFSPRRSRRFPVLKALVRQIVHPERRDLSLDASSQINNNADRNSSPLKNRFRPKIELKESQKLPIESVAHDVMVEQEDTNHLDEKPTRNRRFFLVNVLSRMLRSVNFTAVSVVFGSNFSFFSFSLLTLSSQLLTFHR